MKALLVDHAGIGHIVLVGMMGSGKTTVGRRVAKRLERRLIDTDAEFVAAEDRSIAEWFETEGEASFREIECRIVTDALRQADEVVIATGGGAVVHEATRELLCSPTCTVVWLRASPGFLHSRITQKSERSIRPLLADDAASALVRIDAERRDLYAQVADVIIDIEPVMNGQDKPRKVLAAMVVDAVVRSRGAR